MEPSPQILFIENDAKHADVLSALAQEVGDCSIDIQSSLDQALLSLAQKHYQVVVWSADEHSQILNSMERIKGLNPQASVVVIAREASIEDAVTCMRLGAEDYFLRPVNPDKFKLALKRSFDKRDLFASESHDQAAGYVSLISACQIISGTLDEQRVCETVMAYLKRETNCTGLALYKLQSDRWDRIATSLDLAVDVVDVAVEWSQVITRCRDERAVFKNVPKSVIGPELLVFTMRCASDWDYFMVCANPVLRRNLEELVSMFKMLQAQVQLTGKNIQNYTGVRDLLYQDDATGLYNARFLSVSLDQAFEQQQKTGKPFAVMFLDVDHFKGVNDTHGHLVGTHLLLEIGDVLRQEVRAGDTICRYGGDEFVLILPDITIADAQDVAERIRVSVQNRKFLVKESLNIALTVSIGIAGCPLHAQSRQDIIAAADSAMYHAKKTKRNFVYVAEQKMKSG